MKNDNLIFVATLMAAIITTSLNTKSIITKAESQLSTISIEDVDLALKNRVANKEEVSTEEITMTVEEDLEEEKSEVIAEQHEGILIDDMLFNNTQIRLNTEIYEITEDIYNEEHLIDDYGSPSTKLAQSYLQNMTPIIPIAMTINETGMWSDTRYTWSSAIYSKLLSSVGVDMDRVKIEQVDTDTYVINGLCNYYGCGTNCIADVNSHYHTIGYNDCDSLGPLQILRHYIEGDNYITYDCGNVVLDLMSWDDNVQYFTHTQSKRFLDAGNWNSDYTISNTYELVALMAVAHNTGTAFLNSKSDAGSLWRNSDAVYAYCKLLGDPHSTSVMTKYVDSWWDDVIEAQKNGESFTLLGQMPTSVHNQILSEIGVDKSEYASSFGHKQYYPLKAVLNYLCLERLYYSGGD